MKPRISTFGQIFGILSLAPQGSVGIMHQSSRNVALQQLIPNRSLSGMPNLALIGEGKGGYRNRKIHNLVKDAFFQVVFTARRHASTVYAVVVCPSLCLSVRMSQANTVPKQLNVGSQKQCHTISQQLQLYDAKDFGEISTGLPSTGSPNSGGVGYNRRFSTNISLYLRNGAR